MLSDLEKIVTRLYSECWIWFYRRKSGGPGASNNNSGILDKKCTKRGGETGKGAVEEEEGLRHDTVCSTLTG